MAEGSSRVVMIAVDASKHSDEAFEWYLANMAREADDVKVVHCAEFNLDLGFGLNYDEKQIQQITQQVKEQQDKVDQLKSSYVDRLRGKGPGEQTFRIKGEAFVLTGKKPGEAIIAEAEKQNVNLIIMGTRGLGKIRRTFLGSVSDYVVQHARCPVVVVRK